jgi:DNA polymerase-3 subunit epsilon
MPIKYFAYDTETTGLAPHKGDEIISIAWMLLDEKLSVVSEALHFVRPSEGVVVAEEAAKINGYSPELWVERKALSQQELINALLETWSDHNLRWCLNLGHNVSFDVSFLEALADKNAPFAVGMKNALSYHCVDTLGLAVALDHAHGIFDAPYGLGLLCERYGIPLTNAHDALSDLRATVELYRRLQAHMQTGSTLPGVIYAPFLEKVGEDLVFKKGKHAGISIRSVNRGYIQWVLANVALRREERIALLAL